MAFDSGIGGLSIVEKLRALRPDLSIDYLADNAVYPYGELADEVLIDRVLWLMEAAINFLRPELVVIACNTATTVALSALRARFDVPFVGCVPPIKWAAAVSRTRTIGLLATRATIRRPYLRDLQIQFAPDCTIVAHGARGLADIAEKVFRGQSVDKAAIQAELAGLFGQQDGDSIDVVGVGCTHYSILLPMLRRLSPRSVEWLDPAGAVAHRVASLLSPRPIRDISTESPEHVWFTAPPIEQDRMLQGLARLGFPTPMLMDNMLSC